MNVFSVYCLENNYTKYIRATYGLSGLRCRRNPPHCVEVPSSGEKLQLQLYYIIARKGLKPTLDYYN